METIIIHTEGEKLKAVKQVLKALGVAFETKKEKSAYDPEFVEMVLEARKGKRKRINPNNVWESIS
jgi:hypothetical protein